MSTTEDKKSDKVAKHEPGSKHTLGISRTVYAAGYGLRDGLVWGTVAALGLFGLLTAGNKFEIPGIKPLAEGIVKVHHDIHKWFKSKAAEAKWLKWIQPAVVEASIATWLLVGHIVQIPSSALGWRKAQEAIDKHDQVLVENDQLVEAAAGLAEENKKLTAKLMAIKENRAPIAERIRTQSAEAAARPAELQ